MTTAHEIRVLQCARETARQLGLAAVRVADNVLLRPAGRDRVPGHLLCLSHPAGM